MNRTQALTIFPALIILAALGWRTARDGSAPFLAPVTAVSAATRSAADPRVDSAKAEIAASRFWHASRLIRTATRGGLALTPDETLLLARADFGWRNWAGIVEQLNDKAWLDGTGNGEGWLLLARARQAREEWAPAATAYGRYVSTPHAAANRLLPAIRARQANTLARAVRPDDARAALDQASSAPVVVSWATLDVASVAADSGRVTAVRALLERVTDSVARIQAWELVPRAILASKDSGGALTAYREAVRTAVGATRQARGWSIVGDLARARGDTAAAGVAYRQALAVGSSTAGGARAARGLLALPGISAADALAAAKSLDQANEDGPALEAYDLHVKLSGGSDKVGEQTRLDRARILAVTKGREEEAITEFRAISTSKELRIGAPALEVWAGLRRRQGRAADVATLRERLIAGYPTSAEAADVLFFRGDDAHDRNDMATATREYLRVQTMAPAQDRAGLATMRVAQIHLLKNEAAAAARIYEGYLTAFPGGRRWQEASYWAARARLSLGDTTKATTLVDRLRKDDPFSYYTVIAADLFGRKFALDLPAGDETFTTPDWMRQGLDRIDLLREAGLNNAATSEVERLGARARANPTALLPLAEELIARDRTIEAINLGFEARRQGMPWTIRLAKIIYPFRYQDVFKREAAEDGVDPYLTAALARQESAFVPGIRSVANAVGLMQLLPSTAAALAKTVGPQEFKEEMLEIPDVNVHLGTLHLRDLLKQYDGDITRFLAAYNAGGHRVTAWKDFAEAKDPLTFTERIPFAETRDYVKQVRRNVALYRLLYGGAPTR